MRPLIEEIVGSEITLIDTGAAVARQLQKRLAEKNLLAEAGEPGSVVFWTNSEDKNAEQAIEALWAKNADIPVLKLTM